MFVRDGKRLVDVRSAEEQRASRDLQRQVRDEDGKRSVEIANNAHDRPGKRHTFDDVVVFQTAKRALMQLGYKSRAATKALEQAIAHVGADAGITTLVQAVLARGSDGNGDDGDKLALAKQALVQLGYPSAVARAAIERAAASVDETDELQAIIKEALRFCT